jgi:hypothetical protein
MLKRDFLVVKQHSWLPQSHLAYRLLTKLGGFGFNQILLIEVGMATKATWKAHAKHVDLTTRSDLPDSVIAPPTQNVMRPLPISRRRPNIMASR